MNVATRKAVKMIKAPLLEKYVKNAASTAAVK
jgi:hypothetical protein